MVVVGELWPVAGEETGDESLLTEGPGAGAGAESKREEETVKEIVFVTPSIPPSGLPPSTLALLPSHTDQRPQRQTRFSTSRPPSIHPFMSTSSLPPCFPLSHQQSQPPSPFLLNLSLSQNPSIPPSILQPSLHRFLILTTLPPTRHHTSCLLPSIATSIIPPSLSISNHSLPPSQRQHRRKVGRGRNFVRRCSLAERNDSITFDEKLPNET